MADSIVKRAQVTADGTVSGFLLGIVGWVALHMAAVGLHVRIAVHVFIVVQGTLLVGLALRRYRKGVLAQGYGSGAPAGPLQKLSSRTVGNLLLVTLLGYGLGHFALAQSAFLASLFAIGIAIAPWHHFRSFRSHPNTSALLFICGAVLAFLVEAKSRAPISLLISGWVIWLAACAALLRSGQQRATDQESVLVPNKEVRSSTPAGQ